MSKSILKPILSKKNAHPRDPNLVFDEPTHKYTITTDPDSKYTSVTTWNHSHFPHFDADKVIANMMKGKNWNPENKYWGLTAQQIKDQWSQNAESVSGAGTDLHFDIECFMNQELPEGNDCTHRTLLENYHDFLDQGNKPPNESDEWNYFLQYARAFPNFKPYRTEWMIYDEELKLAGSIDMVYENPDGTLSIYDWKRAKEIKKTNSFNESALTECINHLPHTNYWHYSLQLNTYKAILEKQYNKTVTDLYLVRLHPNNTRQTYDLIKCADLSEEIKELFELRRIQVQKEINT
ncbi:MAG: PD-(D/E)XK nuclease family protein [Crocinitomicaceae bacterium]|nr:PD-(D/E)XK nuclease family protein [Crocinitomicaceae bacterium]